MTTKTAQTIGGIVAVLESAAEADKTPLPSHLSSKFIATPIEMMRYHFKKHFPRRDHLDGLMSQLMGSLDPKTGLPAGLTEVDQGQAHFARIQMQAKLRKIHHA